MLLLPWEWNAFDDFVILLHTKCCPFFLAEFMIGLLF